MLFHCTDLPRSSVPLLATLAGTGYVAVSLFFVLSGFILQYTYCGAERNPSIASRTFYGARVARLYPVYLLGLAVAAPFFVWGHLRRDQPFELARQGLAVLALVQAYVPSLAMAWNPPAWSLSAEAFFYVVFPLMAPALMRIPLAVVLAIAVTSWCGSMGLGVAYAIAEPDGIHEATARDTGFWLDVLKYNPLVRLPEFLIGFVTGRIFSERRSAIRGTAVGAPLLALGLVSLLAASPHVPYVLLHSGLLAPAFALLILWLAMGQGSFASVLGSAPLRLLGQASYSLYVLHVPLVIVMKTVTERAFGQNFTAGPAFTPLFLVLVVGASVLCFRVFESPLQRRVRKFFEA